MNDPAEWEAIHRSRHWGTWPDIHVVRQTKKYLSVFNESMKHVPFHVKAQALDIGCGAGSNARMMIDEGMWVTAFDGSVTAARSASEELGIAIQVATAQTVQFERDSFDFILDNFTLTYLKNPPWERIVSWLRPKGWLIHASFEMAPKGTPMAYLHPYPGDVVERHSSWVEGNAFSFVVRKYVKP